MCTARSKPLFGSSRSLGSHSDHGLMCDARRSSGMARPVSAQRPFHLSNRPARNLCCPSLAARTASDSVLGSTAISSADCPCSVNRTFGPASSAATNSRTARRDELSKSIPGFFRHEHACAFLSCDKRVDLLAGELPRVPTRAPRLYANFAKLESKAR